MISTHKVEVVELKLTKHPNADTLSVAQIYGFTCVTGTDQWIGRATAAYVPPDNLVHTERPEFAFLAREARADGYYRVKAKKIRGVLSFGLLVPAPDGSQPGDDVTEALGVKHYDPVTQTPSRQKGVKFVDEDTAGPDIYTYKYDIESGRRYASQVFIPGEEVIAVEKIDGANGRYVYDDRMYCGSRINWKSEYPVVTASTPEELIAAGTPADKVEYILSKIAGAAKRRSQWWEALTDDMEAFCHDHPRVVLYGEVYGPVQKLTYGLRSPTFAAFDVYDSGAWWEYDRFAGVMKEYGIPTCPVLYRGPYDFDLMCELAEGQSVLADHIREGIVVQPVNERTHPVGRAKLKFVGAGYLERSK